MSYAVDAAVVTHQQRGELRDENSYFFLLAGNSVVRDFTDKRTHTAVARFFHKTEDPPRQSRLLGSRTN
jgi:hypothetical protein